MTFPFVTGLLSFACNDTEIEMALEVLEATSVTRVVAQIETKSGEVFRASDGWKCELLDEHALAIRGCELFRFEHLQLTAALDVEQPTAAEIAAKVAYENAVSGVYKRVSRVAA